MSGARPRRRQKPSKRSCQEICNQLDPGRISFVCKDAQDQLQDFSTLTNEQTRLKRQLKIIEDTIKCYQSRFVDTMEENQNFKINRTLFTKKTVTQKKRLSKAHIHNSANRYIESNPSARQTIQEYTDYIYDSLPIESVQKLNKRTERKKKSQ